MKNLKNETSALVLIDNFNNIIAIIDLTKDNANAKKRIIQALSEHYDFGVKNLLNITFSEKNYMYNFEAVVNAEDCYSEGFYLTPTQIY